MLDEAAELVRPGDAVEFLAAGQQAAGAFHCAACGYGVSVQHTLPQCPMCGGSSWEQAATSPFSLREL